MARDEQAMSAERLAEIRAWNSEYHGWEEQPASDYVDDLLAELDRLKAQQETDMKMVDPKAPTIRRMVNYTLNAQDAEQINRRRVPLPDSIAQARVGAQVHVGNHASEGDVFPMLIVRVWEPVGGVSAGVNGQVFLDGNDTLWVTSRKESTGSTPGHWHWPEPTYEVEATYPVVDELDQLAEHDARWEALTNDPYGEHYRTVKRDTEF